MDKVKTYLIGPIENTGREDNGEKWREYLIPKLEKLGLYVFNPITLESSKTGMNTQETNKKLNGWKRGGHEGLFLSAMDRIWLGRVYEDSRGSVHKIMGDIDYVRESDFLIAHIEENAQPCGTYFEMMVSFLQNKPILLVTSINKTDLSSSLIWLIKRSGGRIFSSYKSLLKFIKEDIIKGENNEKI